MLLNLLNTSFILPLLSNITFIPSTQNLLVQSTFFVNAILLLLILISLVLTFHSKGSLLHKVIGLMLVSVFVVFLWMLQTQFLFIYIVYILAFISAVLMLFLSVVLMLPISNLTSKDLSANKKGIYNAVLFTSLQPTYNYFERINSFIIFIILFLFVMLLIKFKAHLKIVKESNNPTINILNRLFNPYEYITDFILYCNYYHLFRFQKNIDENIECNFELENRFYLLDQACALPSINEFKKYLPSKVIDFWSNFTATIFFNVWSYQRNWDNYSKLLTKIGIVLLTLFMCMTALVDLFLRLFLKVVTLSSIKHKLLPEKCFSLLKAFKEVKELIGQTYLLVCILSAAIISFYVKQTLITYNTTTLDLEMSQGLNQIKALLYGDNSLFLLFSTVVLLVALIGAAVMTRNKK